MITKLAGVVWKKLPPKIRRSVIRLTQSQFTVSTAAIVTKGSGKVLLLDHHIRPKNGWGLPGGFVAPGEQPERRSAARYAGKPDWTCMVFK